MEKFKPASEEKKPINTLENEHLKEGISPIMACLYDRNNIDKEFQYYLDDFKKTAEFVNFSSDSRETYGTRGNYRMSLCNEKNKYSFSYFDCTGIVAVGKDKKTGKNISFLSHQSPEALLINDEVRSNFRRDLIKNLNDLISNCESGSIDVIILGGNEEDLSRRNKERNNFRTKLSHRDKFMENEFDVYQDSIKYLNILIFNKLNFSPVVITGPSDNFKTNNNSLSVYFDNKNRRLYLVRPPQDTENNEAYLASKVENQVKKIQQKRYKQDD